MKAKYINPFTDFGFKKIFGEEASKPLLLDFLNALLPQAKNIIDLTFKNHTQLGLTDESSKPIYDIYCENERGEKFIVELQKARKNYFKERTIYYATFTIQEQAEKGEWNHNLKSVYCIGILGFTFDDYVSEPERKEVVHTVKLKDQNNKIFYDKLTYIYLEMPNFVKTEKELETRLDKWLFFIKYLEDFQSIPMIFKDEIFIKSFEKAELAKLAPGEKDNYENSLKIFRDLTNTIDTAREEGEIKGEIKGETKEKFKVAAYMKTAGESIDKIIQYTGLSREEIEKI